MTEVFHMFIHELSNFTSCHIILKRKHASASGKVINRNGYASRPLILVTRVILGFHLNSTRLDFENIL